MDEGQLARDRFKEQLEAEGREPYDSILNQVPVVLRSVPSAALADGYRAGFVKWVLPPGGQSLIPRPKYYKGGEALSTIR